MTPLAACYDRKRRADFFFREATDMPVVTRAALWLLGAVCLALSGADRLPAQERPLLVDVSISSLSFVQAPYVAARDKGYLRQEGLEPRFIYLNSGVASKALVSHGIDFNTLGSPTINAAIAGMPIRSVFANGSRTDMYLIAASDIRSLEDLKGKKIATGGIGGLADVGARRFLESKGIDTKDVTFLVMGTSGTRMAAVLSGAVSAAPLSPPHDYLAKKAGLKVLGYFGDAFPSYMGGIGIQLDALANRPAVVKGFVKAALKGLRFVHARRAETIDIMMRHMKTQNREMVAAMYDSSVPSFTKDGMIGTEAQQAIIAIAAQAIGRSEAIKPDTVFDFRVVREANRELEAEGWRP
jgi:NitT/TauT family transport system substrate-binding protein